MSKLESIKKTSKRVGRISKVCQIICTVISVICLAATIIIFLMRNWVNEIIEKDNTQFDFSNMGNLANKLASEGKVSEAFTVFGLSTVLYTVILTIILYFISKIFKRFCDEYSPFLLEGVKDVKIVVILVTLLVLISSIGLGIILGFVLYGIVQIYEYGCELQNQSDETL